MLNELQKRMDGAIATLNKEFGGLRTGRASTNLLDTVQVEAYGSMLPMNQVGNVTLIDARTIGVQVWEKNMVAKVEKAIRDSDLGLNPAANGDVIRVPMPALTEERRRDLTDRKSVV